ncbi:hypothetical protein B0T09DRAFT_161759 [Sordaria sp. MPI-SDFR-AT-0083]|nr:hypothetical protein B0T09DRAFT_161759 [Sordaria sp. MPI-SDFR-AT-0083]
MASRRMANSLAPDDQVAAVTASDLYDPFLSPPGQNNQRHSTFDSQLLSLGPGASAEQVKRALKAHLQDTERRMEEAGKLGTALVQQQRELAERLREVEQLQSETEIDPDLRQKLAEIEREYNEVARESARAFLPKQRVPSNDPAQASPSPFSPEERGSRHRSASPSKFESLASASPSKLSIPNRRSRNQPANRIHDIEFAAEISTSLIAQVRNLQALLAEKEGELKNFKVERSRLELEAEGLQQRMRALDESESRYKDENWNLETQIHELLAAQREGADREKKLQQTLNIVQAEKNSTQRELEELKHNQSKQDEKHAATIKSLEIELGTSRRNAALAESERLAMQKKVDELTQQNQELARAFAQERGRALERESRHGSSDDDYQMAADTGTPEHSPPPSPVKLTPRHSGLESETLKTSLAHAHRTIQTLRTNIHREKTEKLELKRMLQDARDEVEKLRTGPDGPPHGRKNRKMESREFKKPRLGQLGLNRSTKTEVLPVAPPSPEDPEWEDQSEAPSPRTVATTGPNLRPVRSFIPIAESSSDHFETANETSDAAFETAAERATETEDFQTGAEEFSDDDSDAQTETEASTGAGRLKRPSMMPLGDPIHRYSFDSTASTSADDEYPASNDARMMTPSAQPAQRLRRGISRATLASNRRSRQPSVDPGMHSSPGSFFNNTSESPQQGQSLFAELNEFGSDDESSVGAATPGRRSIRSVASQNRPVTPPPRVPRLPRAVMVDSGMVTDPVDLRSLVRTPGTPSSTASGQEGNRTAINIKRPISMESVVGPNGSPTSTRGSPVSTRGSPASTRMLGDELRRAVSSQPIQAVSYSDAGVQHDIEPTVVQLLSISAVQSEDIEPTPVLLNVTSTIVSTNIEPVLEPVPEPAPLTVSSLVSEDVEPVLEPEPEPVPLSLSGLVAEDIVPVLEPKPEPVPLAFSKLVSEHVEPIMEPVPEPAPLSISHYVAEHIEPVLEPVPEPAPLTVASFISEHIEPVFEPEPPAPEPIPLSVSSLVYEQVEPRADPEPEVIPPPTLSIPTVLAQDIEPEATVSTPIDLAFSHVLSEHVEPVEVPVEAPTVVTVVEVPKELKEKALPIALGFSSIVSEDVEPQAEPTPLPVPLSLSPIKAEVLEPRQEPEEPLPVLAVSSIRSHDFEPVELPPVPLPALSVSSVRASHIEPVEEAPAPLPALSISSLQTHDIEPTEEPIAPLPALSVSSVQASAIEPVEEPPAPLPPLSISSVQTRDIQPVEEPPAPLPPLSISSVQTSDIQPVEEPPAPLPPLSISSVQTSDIQPVEEPPAPLPPLSISSVQASDIQPVELPATPLPPLSVSSVQASDIEPIELPIAPLPALSLSTVQTNDIEPEERPLTPPPAMSISQIQLVDVEPEEIPAALPPALSVSSILAQEIEPLALEPAISLPPPLAFANWQSLGTEPPLNRSPKRNAFIIPNDPETDAHVEGDFPRSMPEQKPDSQQKPPLATVDQEVQTSLTSEAIDMLLMSGAHQSHTRELERTDSSLSTGTLSTIRRNRSFQEIPESIASSKGKMADTGTAFIEGTTTIRRPNSSASSRAFVTDVPPLPPNHKEAIEAARTGSSSGNQPMTGLMGPPLFSASALRNQNQGLRPRTPSGNTRPMSPMSYVSGRGTPTPRAMDRTGSAHGTMASGIHSPSRLTQHSRKSSVSSFVSEMDTRFQMQQNGGFDPHGFGAGTDPRMIQAITQTMIGEYLWKYTRKAGRGEMSDNRHRRYFWVHPYTRTLYWSDRDPSAAGRSELRAKSVPIEAVRVVADDNPMPPGLHRKSLVIISPGRTVKFTCTTGQRHETWFNALSYLLLRTNEDGQADAEEIAGHITRDDLNDFNPQYSRQAPSGSRGAPSLSSYNSRSLRVDSPALDMSMNIPTLTPNRQSAQNRPSVGTLSRISGYWKESKFGSIRGSRSVSGRDTPHGIYEQSEVEDSAEDVRQMIEQQDREADRLENVRACCDGKHDVGTLTSGSKRGHNHRTPHHHTHRGSSRGPSRGPSTTPSRAGTLRSAA